ncbi:MAG: hypothetical protein WC602_00735 [archaeon]
MAIMAREKSGFPESGLVRKTYCIRRLDFPPSVRLTRKSLLRWFALSIGLISERESRQTALDILDSVLYSIFALREPMTSEELLGLIKHRSDKTVSEKLLLYHLHRLAELGLIVRKKKRYCFNSAPKSAPDSFAEGFNHWVSADAIETLSGIESAFEELSKVYKK